MSLRRLALLLAALVLLVLALRCAREQLAIDDCLDGGGRWDYEREVCEGIPSR